MSADDFFIGQRVADKDGYRATVRYIGPVATSKSKDAIYAGVEWDVQTRGKNDGSVNADGTEVRYFTCAPGAGSFVKLELLTAGTDFLTAMNDRYNSGGLNAPAGPPSPGPSGGAGGAGGGGGGAESHSINSLTGTSGRQVPILLVGDAKIRAQQALGKLTSVSLRDAGVGALVPRTGGVSAAAAACTFAPVPELGAVCPRIRELDLRSNHLSDWATVASLCASLPSLSTLNLADNRLAPLTPAAAAGMAGSMSAIRCLILNDCPLSFQQLMLLDKLAPNLQELHVVRCGINQLVSAPAAFDAATGTVVVPAAADAAAAATGLPATFVTSAFTQLKTLDMTGNPLNSWAQVYGLSQLPALSWLLVAECGLTEVWCPPPAEPLTDAAAVAAAAPALPFGRLEQLSLAGNSLAHQWCIDALDAFVNLTTLRLNNGDITAAVAADALLPSAAPAASAASAAAAAAPALGPSEARQVIVARCPKLQLLNGSEVRSREREDSEKAYTRRVALSFAEAHTKAVAAPKPLLITDIFGTRTIADVTAAAAASAGVSVSEAATTLKASLPSSFSRGPDTGVIRAKQELERGSPFVTSPYPLFLVSSATAPAFIPSLDPWGFSGANTGPSAGPEQERVAATLQRYFPRYFMLAARYELHAPAATAGGLATTLASSVVSVTLRSMAANSCMMEPQAKKLPQSMTLGALKQLVARLFKCDPALQRLSFRDVPSSYPALMDDDMKPLSYYTVCDGGEILIEEIDPAEAARQAADAERARADRIAEQEAQGEALRKAQAAAVAADRRAATGVGL